MAAQFARLTALRQESAAWRLLASPQAPFVAAFFAQEFLAPGRRRVAEAELLRDLEDAMQEAAQARSEQSDLEAGEGLIRPAREYLLMWSDEAHGWLRRFHGADDAPCYDLTAAAEHAVRFAAGLSKRGFLGTESRLRTVVHLLGEIAEDRDEDAAHRERILLEKRKAIDEELAELRKTGKVQPKLTAGQVRERYQQARETAESILEDFRALEEAFGALGRGLMHDIVTWQEGKGELLAKVFERGDVIRESEEGRSFALFWRFLMAGDRQAELDALLAAVSQVPELKEFAAQGGGLSGLLREWVAGAAASVVAVASDGWSAGGCDGSARSLSLGSGVCSRVARRRRLSSLASSACKVCSGTRSSEAHWATYSVRSSRSGTRAMVRTISVRTSALRMGSPFGWSLTHLATPSPCGHTGRFVHTWTSVTSPRIPLWSTSVQRRIESSEEPWLPICTTTPFSRAVLLK